MTTSGFLNQKRETFADTFYGTAYPVSILVEERRRAVNSSNSTRSHGKLQLRPNDLGFLYYKTTVPPNRVIYDYYGYLFDYHVEQVGNIGYYDQVLDEVEATASARFYDKAAQLKVNVGEFLAERRQTVSLVAGTAASLARMFLAIRHGNVPKAIRSIPGWQNSTSFKQFCGQKWLELQYGWKPLLQDIYGAMISTVSRPQHIPVTVKHKWEGTKETEEAVGQWIYKRTHSLRATCTIKCKLDVSSPAAATAHELGLDNPALLAWELLPYSFVVDWFIPIGNWLERQTALFGLEVLEPQTTVTAECLTLLDVRVNPAAVPEPYRSGFLPTVGSGYKKSKRRVLGIPPIPLPNVKNPLSVDHALSAIALLGQAFWRKTPWDHKR